MGRLLGEGSTSVGALVPTTDAAVPASGPMDGRNAPATGPAGTNPTPMTVDEGAFYQPVQAYVQFLQNNLQYTNEESIDLSRHEAEERHAQIMEQMVKRMLQECEIRS